MEDTLPSGTGKGMQQAVRSLIVHRVMSSCCLSKPAPCRAGQQLAS